jgi:hypothetical protein
MDPMSQRSEEPSIESTVRNRERAASELSRAWQIGVSPFAEGWRRSLLHLLFVVPLLVIVVFAARGSEAAVKRSAK